MDTEKREIFDYLIKAGFFHLKEVPGRGICGLNKFIFTTGLCYNLQKDDMHIYDGRYCFEFMGDAQEALDKWDGIGDPSGDWIKHKGKVEYSNPINSEP